MNLNFQLSALVNAIVYAVLGVAILFISFVIWDKISPYELWKEIAEKNNTALAIFAGLMALGVAIIVASAVH